MPTASPAPVRRPPAPRPPGRARSRRLLGHEMRALSRLAGPVIVAQLGGIAMHTTDTIMVAPLGAEALGAAGIATATFVVAFMVCQGVVLGMSPLVSQAFGAGDERECRHVLVQGLWVAAALSVPLTLFTAFGGAIVRLLGQPEGVARLAGEYTLALAPGVGPLLVFTAFRQYLEGRGRTRPAMVATFVGVAVNIVGNRVLIYGVPGVVEPLGVIGSGIATSLVRWAMLAWIVAYVVRDPELRPSGVRRRPDAALAGRIARIGGPIGAQLGAEVGIFAMAAVMMGWIGAAELAAHQVAINIASATFMVAMGTSMAGVVRVGAHVGAGSPRAVRRSAVATYLLSLGFMAVTALVFVLFPAQLVGLYTTDARIVGIATTILYVAGAFQLFDGAQVAGLCVLRGAADTRVPMWITIGGYWAVGMPAAYLLGFTFGLGPVGIWSGLCIALGVVALMLWLRVRRVLWSGRLQRAIDAAAR